jgi:transketolase
MKEKIKKLQEIANDIRIDTFKAIANAGGGHFGGSLSIAEILTVLYFEIMNINPDNPKDENRDIFILSKGHGGPALYTTLAKRGFYPYSDLKDLDKPLSKFPKHVDRLRLPSIEISTGPLGQGLSIACGMAISLKQTGKKNLVYVLLGDGELNSGQVWEAAMTASKYKLDNIIAIVDRNNCQVDGPAEEVMPMEPLELKWNSFGWHTFNVDGHNIELLINIINSARHSTEKPKIIIAKTVKGCGISFMENKFEWHSGSLTDEQYQKGLLDLKGNK